MSPTEPKAPLCPRAPATTAPTSLLLAHTLFSDEPCMLNFRILAEWQLDPWAGLHGLVLARMGPRLRASLIISPTAVCSGRGTAAGPGSIYCHASFSTNRRRRRLSQPAWTGDSRDGDLLLSLHFSLLHVGPSRQTGNHNTCSKVLEGNINR